MSKILVTGGCGFIGSNLVSILRDAGHIVTIIDNFSRGNISYLGEHSAYNIIELDVRDKETVLSVSKYQDVVIHLAAYGSVVESLMSPEENFSINVGGTFSVLEAAREAGIKQVIFASTGGALIGNAPPPVNEQSLPRPISPYGASKLAGEGYCCAFANAYDMSIMALRFANIVGPISWHKKGAITTFFKAILDDIPIRIYGDGSATRDFLYVEDLCRGILSALNLRKPGYNVFHLASGREISINKLAKIACDVASVPNHKIFYESRRKGEVERNFANYDLASKELGFHPSVSFEDAMKKTWEWFQCYNQNIIG